MTDRPNRYLKGQVEPLRAVDAPLPPPGPPQDDDAPLLGDPVGEALEVARREGQSRVVASRDIPAGEYLSFGTNVMHYAPLEVTSRRDRSGREAPRGLDVLPRLNETATVVGVVHTIEALFPDGHYRITLDVDLSKRRVTPPASSEVSR